MNRSCEGKVALVTGGAAGIGRATALAFAREGARVAIADTNLQGAAETLRGITELGSTGTVILTDVTNPEDVVAMVEKTVEMFGQLDVAVNNAGVLGSPSPLHETDDAMYRKVMDVNVLGVFLCLKAEIAQMLKQGRGGSIVNTASVAGILGFRGFSPYDASKHAVLGLTKTAALEYVGAGIRVNAVCPAIIDTQMTTTIHAVTPQLADKMVQAQPMRRAGRPEEVAEAILWLASDASSFVTGSGLPVDGGLIAT